MQPYFFPYIGYFQLINAVDKFIIFDEVQYIDRGWMNRNRILSQNLTNEWEYISIPINKKDKRNNISDVRISNSLAWDTVLFGKLTYYKKIRAPYYDTVINLLKSITKNKNNSLSDLNTNALIKICNYFNIDFDYKIASHENYDYSDVNAKDEWALQISIQEGTKEYINPIGGIEFFDKQKFISKDVNIKFLQSNNISYKQSKREFVPNLSIVDVMMFNSPKIINEMLKQVEYR